MFRFRKILPITISFFITLSLPGCITVHETPQPQTPVIPLSSSEPDSAALKRFKEPDMEESTPVESALELSEKYSKLVEQAAAIQKENERLKKENAELNNKLITENATLTQTEQELKEANDMLIDMRIELNNWKMDVLGFREEIRSADKAQLEALLKILKTLGGNIEDTTLATQPESDPNETRT